MKVINQSLLSHTQIFKERLYFPVKDQKSIFTLPKQEYSILNSTCRSGGAKRDRTVDLLRARQALSQLSYGPIFLQVLPNKIGGSGQIRTADLTLIRGAL